VSIDRKTAEVRERELRLALSRIQRGRSRTKAKRLSIAAVAREAGVTAALIHNHYPSLATAIREAMGRGERASRDEKTLEFKALRARVRELNGEVKALRADVARLASINEVLMAENTSFKARVGTVGTVIPLSPTPRRSNS
jgi:AcrR family transcriptional regulator